MKFFVCLCLYFVVSLFAYADLNIKNWKQKNEINITNEQKVSISVELKAENLQKNYYHDSWGYVFDKKSDVKIIKVEILNSKEKKYSFKDNVLEFKFDNLFNNKSIFINFEYVIKNKKNNKYLRNEFVQIPNFAEKAKGELTVIVPNIYDVYSLNENMQLIDYGHYSWSGTIPTGGIVERFDLTKKKAKWEIVTRIVFKINSMLTNAKMKVPMLYIGGNNNIYEYIVYTNQINYFDNKTIKKDGKYILADFENLNSNQGFLEIRAIFENSYNDFEWLNNFDLNKISYTQQEYEETLATLANNIINENKKNSPIYVKIGQWVYNNITYNSNFLGKKMSPLEILNKKQGVCEHYSVLYENLLKSIGIPAVSVSGVAYNEEKKTFEPHAWTLVYYNEDWLPMDATWGIFSGKLPISHIFSFNSLNEKYSVNTMRKVSNEDNYGDKITLDINNEVNFIEF